MTTKKKPQNDAALFNIAWDIDDTLIFARKKRTYTGIVQEDGAYLNPLMIGKQHNVKIAITGRHETKHTQTREILRMFNLEPIVLLMNPEDIYETHFIASIKARFLDVLGVEYYVEENPKYRDIMAQHWNGTCITVRQALEILEQ